MSDEAVKVELEVSWSPSIAKLVEALAKAQLKFKPVFKQTENAAFKRGDKVSKYADLATYIDATQEALATEGLVVVQFPDVSPEAKSMGLTSILAHSSGEWMKGRLTLPAIGRDGFTAQSCGSSITYARRYSYAAMTGCASEDDDGNAASGRGSTEAAQEVARKGLEANLKSDNPKVREIAKEGLDNLEKQLKDSIEDVKRKKAATPSLFFRWPATHNGNTAFITGDVGLLSRFKDALVLKGHWSNAQNAFLIPSENFDDVKYVIENAEVPFKELKSA